MSKNKKYMYSSFNKSKSPVLNKYISSINSSSKKSDKTIKQTKKMLKKSLPSVNLPNTTKLENNSVDNTTPNYFSKKDFSDEAFEILNLYNALYIKKKGEKTSIFSVKTNNTISSLSKREKLRSPSILDIFVINTLCKSILPIDTLKKQMKNKSASKGDTVIKVKLPKPCVTKLKESAKQARMSPRSLLEAIIHSVLRMS